MSNFGLTVFDETAHTTNVWLKDLMDRLGWIDRGHAYRALRTTLHALRDRLPVNTAAAFAAQLPMLVRGFYYEGWRPAQTPSGDRSADEFVRHITDAFRNEPHLNAHEIVVAVFGLLSTHISEGEISHVKKCLPEEIRELWPDA